MQMTDEKKVRAISGKNNNN